MGQRGPKPKPTSLRLLHGDRPDRVNMSEPMPDVATPDCPESITDPDVRAVWRYTVEQLSIMGCITMADRDALACYCEAVVVHRKASAILAKSSVLIRSSGEDARLIRNPVIAVQRDAATLVARYAQHFGLTPSARSEIRMGAQRPTNNVDRYLTG